MRLRTTALAAGLMAATVPSLTVPAEAWGGGGYSYYSDCGYGYWSYGHVLIYSYGCGYPACGEHRYASHRYVRRHAPVLGVRLVRAAASSSGATAPRASSSASKTVQAAPADSASPSNAWTPMTVPISPSPANKPSKAEVDSTLKELKRAKADVLNDARASEARAHRKLPDTEADLKRPKEYAGRATEEARGATEEAGRAKEEAGRAVSEWAKKFEVKLNQLSSDMQGASVLLDQEGFKVDSGNKFATGWFLTAHDRNQRRGSIKVQTDGTKIIVTVTGEDLHHGY